VNGNTFSDFIVSLCFKVTVYLHIGSSKKQKQRRTNKNTSQSEEAKIGLADEAMVIVSSGQKERVEKRNVL